MRGDRGLGLIEVIVVMSLTTLALSIFGMAYSAMVKTSDRSRDMGSVTDQVRLAVNELDRQVRFGYWVRDASMVCPSGITCPGIKVLTPDAAGVPQCWFWVVDLDNGRLLSFRYPQAAPVNLPPLAAQGGQGSNQKWHIAAGPEGEPLDEARISAGTLGVVQSSLVHPFDPNTLLRTSYYVSAAASFTVVKGDRPPVTVSVEMSVRNQWIGAPLAAAYPNSC